MQKVLVLGAGLSSSYLIQYLLQHATQYNWQVTIADASLAFAQQKINGHRAGVAVELNASDTSNRQALIAQHDIIISMLPAIMHPMVARDCLTLQKHLVTASYISPEMLQMDAEAKVAGILFLNECGLDPGIDHMSAMKIIHEIQAKGGTVTSFKSFCGGLVAPEFDNNPWNYKFTWNPRNVVVAGQATARYMEHGVLKFIPPSHIFEQTEAVSIDGYGDFESYANRDSLGYIEPYGITTAHTVLRGTLRRKGYSKSWNLLVKLGLTDDNLIIEHANQLTLRGLVNAFVPGTDINKLETRICNFLHIHPSDNQFERLKWLGLFEETAIPFEKASPAQILQWVLQTKWTLNAGDLDMIVMKHQIQYQTQQYSFEVESNLVVKGEDERLTAMAKTVGLPLAIAAKLILQNQIKARGVHMPTTPELYEPILKELETFNITFTETEKQLS